MPVIARRDGAVLRHLEDADWPRVDALVAVCYAPIHASYVAMLGDDCYAEVRHDPELTWQERKQRQVRRLHAEQPGHVWVLEDDAGDIFGFVTFRLFPDRSYGAIDNNGVHPDHAGQGWGKWMYRHVLQQFRREGLRFAFVDTGRDDAHIPARRAYDAVGFDRRVPVVEYWQDLTRNNPGSAPDDL
jgi:ribosomal protein S18 acetylase RimI-like enzyme